jgi:hypothetical protein
MAFVSVDGTPEALQAKQAALMPLWRAPEAGTGG